MKKNSALQRLMGYAGPYRYLTYASWGLSALSALFALMPFVYIWQMIRDALGIAHVGDGAGQLAHYGWMAVLFAGLSLVIYVGALMCSHLSAFHIAGNIRKQTVRHALTMPAGVLDGVGTGKMRKIINESSAATETYLAHQLPDRAGAVATPVGMLALLLVFDWRLGLISLIPAAIAFFLLTRMTGPRMKNRMDEYQNALEEMSNEAVEYVRGIAVVKTFGQSVFSFKRFKASIDNYEKWVISYTRELRRPMVLYTTVMNGIFAALTCAALLMSAGGITETFLLNLLFYILFTPILTVTMTKIMYSSENAMIVEDALKRVDTVLDVQPLPETHRPAHPRDNSITVNDVSCRYPGAKQDALKHLSLSIREGENVAFVGPSGGGKTTLACLLDRFWDVSGGSIRIGGVDVREIPPRELTQRVSFVFQDSKLLKTSILENVRMGKPGAGREEVLAALHKAQCDDILAKFPQGVDTVVGTKGVYLSGGEMQRIAIARVMLRDTPILILDEATAYADPDNEQKVQAAFAAMARGKTVITIAHRLSTVTGVDRIYVLRDGAIAEQGGHEELVRADRFYAHLWKLYQSTAQWKVKKEAAIG